MRQLEDAVTHLQTSGDVNAVFERYRAFALRIIRKHLPGKLRRRLCSSDILQDAWLSVLKRPHIIQSLNNSTSCRQILRAFARRKAIRTYRDHVRLKRSILRECSVEGANIMSHHESASEPEQVDLWKLVAPVLTAAEQRVIKVLLAGHSNREAAAILGTSEASIRRLLTRVRRTLARNCVTIE
ncbi:MAG: sigma-70 family RNA polymerase sigma factor [Planctomycetaceae bacterium]|nr:sigma-70 family RNA polymerase sigma factor [Planctomycetaceae bacterium]